MNRRFHHAPFLLIVLAFLAAPIARAQTANQDAKQPHARIALYRVAPGKHLEFLKWLADRDAIDKEAGVPASKIPPRTPMETRGTISRSLLSSARSSRLRSMS